MHKRDSDPARQVRAKPDMPPDAQRANRRPGERCLLYAQRRGAASCGVRTWQQVGELLEIGPPPATMRFRFTERLRDGWRRGPGAAWAGALQGERL